MLLGEKKMIAIYFRDRGDHNEGTRGDGHLAYRVSFVLETYITLEEVG